MTNPDEMAGGIAPQSGVDEQAALALADKLEGKAPASSGLTTHSDEWEQEAATLPNKDLYVPVVDLMFDGQTKLAMVKTLEKQAADAEGRGKAVRIGFEMLEELTSVEGIKKSPGYVFKPRAFTLVEANADKRQQAEIGQRTVNKLLIAAGVATKAEALNREQVYGRIGKLAGRRTLIKFTVKKSSTRDPETGDFYVNQNLAFAVPDGSGNGPVEGQATARAGDY